MVGLVLPMPTLPLEISEAIFNAAPVLISEPVMVPSAIFALVTASAASMAVVMPLVATERVTLPDVPPPLKPEPAVSSEQRTTDHGQSTFIIRHSTIRLRDTPPDKSSINNAPPFFL